MIDSHVHIDAEKYQSRPGGVAQVLQEAAEAGVERVVAPSIHFDSFARLVELAEQFPQVFPAAGIHPHDATQERNRGLVTNLNLALDRLKHPIVGETGLEGHYDFVPMDIQLESLRAHLEVAMNRELPLILHCRKTEELLYQELSQRDFPAGGVIHCFTGTWEWAQKFLDLGFHIGITGIVTFKSAEDVQEVAKRIDLERLLVETDGPYLAPIPHRGRLNLSAYIPLIVEKIAELRGLDSSELGRITAKNTNDLFRLPT